MSLGGVTGGTVAVLALLYGLVPGVQQHGVFAIATLVLFILLCLGLFFAGRNAAQSASKVAFNNLVSASVFGKMVLALGFLYAYHQIAHPTNEWFVGIFLLAYVVYTVFEVWFMTKLAKG